MRKTSIQNANYKNYKDISAPDCQSFFGKNEKKSGSPFHFMIDISQLKKIMQIVTGRKVFDNVSPLSIDMSLS